MTECMSKFKSKFIERQLLVGTGIVLLILFLIGGIAWNNSLRSASAVELVDHTRKVMAGLGGVRARLDGVENGQWAYFLTREKKFLMHRDKALADLKIALQDLDALTVDNGVQQERLRRLRASVDQRMRYLHDSQQVFDASGFIAAQALFEEGQKVTLVVHRIALEAEQMEQGLLAQRKASELIRLRVIGFFILLLLACMGALAVWIEQVMSKRLLAANAMQEQLQPIL